MGQDSIHRYASFPNFNREKGYPLKCDDMNYRALWFSFFCFCSGIMFVSKPRSRFVDPSPSCLETSLRCLSCSFVKRSCCLPSMPNTFYQKEKKSKVKKENGLDCRLIKVFLHRFCLCPCFSLMPKQSFLLIFKTYNDSFWSPSQHLSFSDDVSL